MKALALVFALLCAAIPASAQNTAVADTSFRVSGNCGMCKSRIEKALTLKEVKYAKWDKSTKMVRISYSRTAITVDSLQHRIALAGHDTERYRAPDSVYAELPGCCLYRDKTGSQ